MPQSQGLGARSKAYFKTMFLAFREDGAKDWISNLTISLLHSGKQHKLQFHHVFPRAILKDKFRPIVINDIANLSFIGGKTNRKISAKSPHVYFPQIIKEQGDYAFQSQCIPTDESLLTADKYLDFMRERRRLIADRLNRFLEDARKPHGSSPQSNLGLNPSVLK